MGTVAGGCRMCSRLGVIWTDRVGPWEQKNRGAYFQHLFEHCERAFGEHHVLVLGHHSDIDGLGGLFWSILHNANVFFSQCPVLDSIEFSAIA